MTFGNRFGMPLAYHTDVPTETYVPIALAILGVVTLVLVWRLREPPPGDLDERFNWPAAAAIVLCLVALAAYGVAWLVPTEAESGVRRTIADVCLIVVLAYVFAVGPVLGIAGVSLVRSRGQKLAAIAGFLLGCFGLASAIGALVACGVSDGCFH
jgi:cytochrome bd-type quinol oxidase subunit 2